MTGDELKELRQVAGLKAKDVADALGYGAQRWSMFENGHVPIPKVVEAGARWVCRNGVKARDDSAADRLVAMLKEVVNG